MLVPSQAFAWDGHAKLSRFILEGIPETAQASLKKPIPAPCGEHDQAVYQKLIKELELNPQAKFRPTAPQGCAQKEVVSGWSVLSDTFENEPDQGMDENLPDSYDPEGFRRWMGGVTGPNSKGFRHMYFGGWKTSNPLTTFQIPTRAIGYAPLRAKLMAEKAHQLIHQGETAWGYRVLAWSMHYYQDLAQPFHATQLPNLAMVPWSTFFQDGFDGLVQETTRTISNYHWGFEAYTSQRLNEDNPSPFDECLKNSAGLSTIKFEKSHGPFQLAHEVAYRSVQIAPDLGRALIGFFGDSLKKKGIDIAHGEAAPDYRSLASREDLASARTKLHEVTCRALANAVVSSRLLVEWAIR